MLFVYNHCLNLDMNTCLVDGGSNLVVTVAVKKGLFCNAELGKREERMEDDGSRKNPCSPSCLCHYTS